MLPTYLFLYSWDSMEHDFKSFSFDSYGTISSKLSFNVIPYPLLKIIAGKALREIFLRVIMLFWKILSNVTLLGINANLSLLFDTSLSALTPPPSLQKEKILLC